MKKLLLALLAVILTASFAYAEIGAQTFSGNANQNFREQQVFIDCYNGSGSSIGSNFVVILDTATANTTSGTNLGTRITTTAVPGNWSVVGVTDQVIANGSVGRVCVRGPHKVRLQTGAPSALGATLTTSALAGAATDRVITTSGGVFGVALATTACNPEGAEEKVTDNPLYYWAYIGNAGN